MRARHVIVVGAGLAGLTAAIDLVEAGHRVTVLERRPVVGGRTSSWDENGMEVESGLHRFLGFYAQLPQLIRRVGLDVDDVVVWQDEIEIIAPDDGPRAVFGASTIHRPFETLGSLVGNTDFLPMSQKLAIGRMIAAGVADYTGNPEELDTMSVAGFARVHGVADEVIFRLLVPLTEGLFFVPPDEYSAYNFFGLIVPYGAAAAAARVGAFRGGMTPVLAEPLARHVRAQGGEVHTATPVDRLLVDNGRVTGVLARGAERSADAVVLAASLGPAQSLIRSAFGEDPRFSGLLALQPTPSVTFQMELDEPAMPVDRTTFGPGTLLASFSEQSRSTFSHLPGRLSVILARPADVAGVDPHRLLRQVCGDASRLGVDIEDHVTAYRKVTIPTDFYSMRRGSERLRPAQKTPVPGLVLAGDYTAQDYLATMEGAVVSGLRAASAARELVE